MKARLSVLHMDVWLYASRFMRRAFRRPYAHPLNEVSMPAIHRIGVISDTHIPKRAARVPDAALRLFEDVELILHAGDLSSLAVVDQLVAYAPVEAVQGNVELPEVVAALPIKRELVVGGCAIGLVHILGERSRYLRTTRAEFPSACPSHHNSLAWASPR